MKIFILEDNADRIDFFRWYFPSPKFELFIYTNAFEAKDKFDKSAPYDLLLLDHDLDNKIFVDSADKNTGYQFAKFLEKKNVKNVDIIVHSINYSGAMNMCSILPEAKYIPYNILANMLVKGEIKFDG